MYKSYDDVLKLRVSDMQMLALMASGKTQTKAAELSGTHQPRVSKVIRKIEMAYGITVSVGNRSYWKLTDEGIRLGKHFEEILEMLKDGQTKDSYAEKIADVKIALRSLSEKAEQL